MAELHPPPFSQDFIKWIFGVIRDTSWDSCFSFLMITNRIHEVPAGINWKTKVYFSGLVQAFYGAHRHLYNIYFFIILVLVEGSVLGFLFWFCFLEAFEFPMALPLCRVPSVSHTPKPQSGHRVSLSLPWRQSPCDAHCWSPSLLWNKGGDCPLMQIPLLQICFGLIIWTQIFSFPITQNLICLSCIFYISHSPLLTAQAQFIPLAILITTYLLVSL